jgi:tRNA modification GTPase
MLPSFAMYASDTIVAPATPAGRGAIAIIRLSGPDAIKIAYTLWHPLSPPAPSRTLRLGEIRDPLTGATLDRALCAIFPAPRSFTGEDVAELHCHGGVYLVSRIVGLAADAGARIAEPGEFSRRAYLNGRIDLTAAEAIADLIDARGAKALAQAVAQLGGALAQRVDGLRHQLITIRAHLEAEIDFADEDLSLPSRAALADAAAALAADIGLLHDSFARGRLTREGARAAIIGKPNAGKSSILNLLLGIDRAIVTPIPGTTRDVIEDTISLAGMPLILADTAGLRESDDAVEKIGIERTRVSAAEAELLIAVFDSARPFDADDERVIAAAAGRAGVAILNKRDLAQHLYSDELCQRGLRLPVVELSTVTTAGVAKLREQLGATIEELAGDNTSGAVTISRERHRVALARAREAVGAAYDGLNSVMPPEIVAVDIELATEAVGSITGAIDSEDILDAIFREFCIGK